MRKIIAIVLAMGAAAGVFAQTYTTPLKLVSPRVNGPEVVAVQTRLIELGFLSVGSADGWFGPLTRDAVSSFQRFFGFSETGIVDRQIWTALLTDSKKQAALESAIVEANAILASKYIKKSHDIMDQSSEGGSVDQYFANGKVAIEDFMFYGEMGKVEYKVVHLANGLVVLKKTYRYPKPFDVEHATIENVAFYFTDKASLKLSIGKAERSDIKDLPIRELIGKTDA